MLYLILVGISGFIFAALLIGFRQHFFKALESAVGLSNAVLSDQDDLIKQKGILNALKALLLSFGTLLLVFALIIVATAIPIVIYALVQNLDYNLLDLSSYKFWLSFSAGTIIPFLLIKKKSNSNYSESSQLLHRLILNNYHLGRLLFSMDKRFKKDKDILVRNDFLLITGLARAGTTSLMTQIHASGKFDSLDYSNMPLIVAPNMWRKIYKPQPDKLKERSHGDKVLFGYNTVEALEEYFFKMLLNDSYIHDDKLVNHQIDEATYKKYLDYQTKIRRSNASIYITKNNNAILRYQSLRKWNTDFVAVFMFRDPIAHASSLLNQHLRFSALQEEDHFVEMYMNWLGHHEFGNNQKPFVFNAIELTDAYEKDSINYWLAIWINYYSNLLNYQSRDYLLIDYDDYLLKPKEVLLAIAKEVNCELDLSSIQPFVNRRKDNVVDIDEQLLTEAQSIFKSLKEQKIKL